MKIRYDQLTQHLQRQLAPIYLISSDEILLAQETLTQIRQAAQQANYLERIIIEAENNEAWINFNHETQNISLFSNKRIIECRLNSGKLSDVGSKALLKFAENPPPDTFLLITAAKLTQPQQNSAWFKAIDKIGVIIQIWPLSLSQLPAWLDQRLRAVGLTTDQKGIQTLALQVEGNLLAAAQEIEKLQLLYGNGFINNDQIATSISGNNRYDIFNLVDSILLGEAQRSIQILQHLRSEGTEPPVILWALTREMRSLASMALAQQQSMSFSQIFQNHGVWEQRKNIVQRALQRIHSEKWLQLIQYAAYIDSVVKGLNKGNVWQDLQLLCLEIAGKSLALGYQKDNI